MVAHYLRRNLSQDSHEQRSGRATHPRKAFHQLGKLLGNQAFGQALDADVRMRMEARFGQVFDDVRIHAGAQAAQAAHGIGAAAFTYGEDIIFGERNFQPRTPAGEARLAHELAHVVQQRGNGYSTDTAALEEEADMAAQAVAHDEAVDVKPDQAAPQIQMDNGGEGSRLRLRLPTIEAFGALHGDFLAFNRMRLTSPQRSIATSVFGQSLDLDRIHIVYTPVVNAPTTLGNNIRIPVGGTISDQVLVHELAHVWQYQTKGTDYISDSLYHQVTGILTTGNRNAAYQYTIVPGQSIHRYTAEQQAMIIQDYYADPALHVDPEYVRMIEEVRASRPLPELFLRNQATDLLQWGTSPGLTPPPIGPLENTPQTVPLLRFEFDMPWERRR